MTARPAPFLFEAPGPRVYSIGPDLNFLGELASAVTCAIEAGDGVAAIADVEIFLPTRRAVRALGDAFLAVSGEDGATFLPRIRAIGDVDEEDVILFKGAASDELALAPPVSDVERRITLARLVAAKDRASGGEVRWAGALAAADELAALIDAFHTEEVDPGVLATVAPDDLAEHWARSLEFLDVVTKSWPAHLEEIGRMDPAARRVRLINAMAEQFKAAPPDHPVIIAGTTGSTPAVARLIDVVSMLPKGCVILPGLDLAMDEPVWRTVDDPHPQSGLKHLLESGLGLARQDVRPWPGGDDAPSKARNEVINVALRPAAATDSWRDWAQAFKEYSAQSTDLLAGLALIEAEDEEREADAVAIRIREALCEADQTVFLVTPDRDLTRRVSAKLLRWGVEVDDSAGVPFSATPCGGFLRLIARAISDPADPAALVAVFRHPLFGGGVSGAECAAMVNAGDLALRGLKPEHSEILRNRLSVYGQPSTALVAYAEKIAEVAGGAGMLDSRLMDHLRIAEAFAATDKANGADRLWRGEDGERGAAHLNDLLGVVAGVSDWNSAEYHEIFDRLIAGVTVRRRSQAHRRVAILGPLEARLQSADVVILGGLNEGVWPRDAAIDGFLSRGMRKTIGLPSPERRIGLSAHDFAQLSASPHVVLTRAKKAGGKPSTPSRWIIRLKNILAGAGALVAIDRSGDYAALAESIDTASLSARPAPRPRPPVSARPAQFSVTRVETLLRDPYAVYARSILRLKPLDAFNEPLDYRHIGILFHKVFEDYAREAPPADHIARMARLEALFEQAAASTLGAAHLPFWRARAHSAFEWFAEWDAARRTEGAPAVIEGRGEWSFDHEARRYHLLAKADRIDLLSSGAAAIYDYKTGEPPPTNKQQSKFSPQLPLTAAIVSAGGFEALGAVPVDRFAYLRALNRKAGSGNETGAAGADCAAMIEETVSGFKSLLSHFNDPQAVYPSQPRPQFVAAYGDYDHLARRRERRAMDGAE